MTREKNVFALKIFEYLKAIVFYFFLIFACACASLMILVLPVSSFYALMSDDNSKLVFKISVGVLSFIPLVYAFILSIRVSLSLYKLEKGEQFDIFYQKHIKHMISITPIPLKKSVIWFWKCMNAFLAYLSVAIETGWSFLWQAVALVVVAVLGAIIIYWIAQNVAEIPISIAVIIGAIIIASAVRR
jgi:hypothetical protein